MRQAPERRRAVPSASKPDDTAALAAEVQAQTLRLKNRVSPPRPLRRSPSATPSRSPRAPRPSASDAAPPDGRGARAELGPPLEPAIELIGVAENEIAEGRRAHRDHLGARAGNCSW